MPRYQALRKRLAVNYIASWAATAVLALLSIRSLTLHLPAAESRYLAVILTAALLLSLLIGICLIFRQVRPYRDIQLQVETSTGLQQAYDFLHTLPTYAFCRILYPHYICLSLPVVLLSTILRQLDLLHISFIHTLYIVISLFFAAHLHAIIEFIMTTRAIRPYITAVKNKAKAIGALLTYTGKQFVSLGSTTGMRTTFIIIMFPLLLIFFITEVQQFYFSKTVMREYAGGPGVWLLLLGIGFSMVAAARLIKPDTLEAVEQDLQTKDGQIQPSTCHSVFYSMTEGFNRLSLELKERDELVKQLQDSYFCTLSAALDARDPYTAGHSMRVAEYSVMIGRKLGLAEEELDTLYKTALIHDIGKVGIPDMVLLKEGKLSEEEYLTIQRHPVLGESILQHVQPAQSIKPFLSGVRSHHERYDGKGYPDQLAGERIPLFGRIIAVADAFDAMTSDRPYRKGMKDEEAISILEQGRGTQWDPIIAGIFVDQYRCRPSCC
ncbi:HD-GYP domain-containing protein [Paenibacillus urinalis]|uniref:HD-GYP domain-containing protein n=1 Tax=Paenibacillus urinalis TaxID=521520 RepID=A0AAX3N041_9BACL|nr:HD-GYP domain-containing protein [Paenibacillus urinalis]WDH83066.1 HD-GYP domain-containing protein [Paenibacillus urinalis]